MITTRAPDGAKKKVIGKFKLKANFLLKRYFHFLTQSINSLLNQSLTVIKFRHEQMSENIFIKKRWM